jgi:hypothetical protein
VGVPPVVDWAPSPDAVAQLLRARTKDSDGVELGVWTDDTRPTLTEVQGIIDTAVGNLAAAVGTVLQDPCREGATGCAALLAAMMVELSYFPEQVRSDRSAYSEYKTLYDEQLTALRACVEASSGGEVPGVEGAGHYSVKVIPEVTAAYAVTGALATAVGPFGDLPGDHWPEPENPANWAQPFQPPREPPLPEDLPVGDAPASGEELE